MQIDCYKRNFKSCVCSTKCKFFAECSRANIKEKTRHIDVLEIKDRLWKGEFK